MACCQRTVQEGEEEGDGEGVTATGLTPRGRGRVGGGSIPWVRVEGSQIWLGELSPPLHVSSACGIFATLSPPYGKEKKKKPPKKMFTINVCVRICLCLHISFRLDLFPALFSRSLQFQMIVASEGSVKGNMAKGDSSGPCQHPAAEQAATPPSPLQAPPILPVSV